MKINSFVRPMRERAASIGLQCLTFLTRLLKTGGAFSVKALEVSFASLRPSRKWLRHAVPLGLAVGLVGWSAIELHKLFYRATTPLEVRKIELEFNCEYSPEVYVNFHPSEDKNDLQGALLVDFPKSNAKCTRLMTKGLQRPEISVARSDDGECGKRPEGWSSSDFILIRDGDGGMIGLELGPLHEKYGACMDHVEFRSDNLRLIQQKTYTNFVFNYQVALVNRTETDTTEQMLNRALTSVVFPPQYEVTSQSAEAKMSPTIDGSQSFIFNGPIVMFLRDEERSRTKEVWLFILAAIFATGISILAEYLTNLTNEFASEGNTTK